MLNKNNYRNFNKNWKVQKLKKSSKMKIIKMF